MPTKQRRGNVWLRVVAVSGASVVGAAVTLPYLASPPSDASKVAVTSVETVAEDAIAASDSARIQNPSASINEAPTLAPAKSTENESLESTANADAPVDGNSKTLKAIQVFYATDRQLVHASDAHLWITTCAPTFLAGTLFLLLTLGAIKIYFDRRRLERTISHSILHSSWLWNTACLLAGAVTVFFASRSVWQAQQLVRLARTTNFWFTANRFEAVSGYPLQLGTCTVTLPPNHRSGFIERPSLLTLQWVENENKHVVLQELDSLDEDKFFEAVSRRVDDDPLHSAFVFIHGYNVTFDDALRRTAQMAADIGFQGAAITYSWPSQGRILGYNVDEANVAWSVTHLETLLDDVRLRTGVKRFHLMAHSMGNRALVGALERISLKHPQSPPLFDQIIMAAPDLDAGEFKGRYASSVSSMAQRATLYISSTDRALLLSMKIHGQSRLGLTCIPQPTVDGIDLIDVTPVDTSLLGHSYYGSHPLMIEELRDLLELSYSPLQRKRLISEADRTPPLWRFRQDLQDSIREVAREAIPPSTIVR